jgi:putrescine aminotransferase
MNPVVDTAHIQSLDSAHYLHPFTDFKDLNGRGARVMTRAEDIYVWDSEGRRVLDAMSGLWCVNVGYGRKEIAEAAYRQMMELPYYNSFFQTTNVPATRLAAKLASLAPDVGDRSFKHVFFSSSGSESNDSNVRMVRRYWDLLGQPQRKVIIGRINGYHGSTMAGASLGGMSGMHAQGDLPIPNITHIEQPYFFEKGNPPCICFQYVLRITTQKTCASISFSLAHMIRCAHLWYTHTILFRWDETDGCGCIWL